MNYKGLEEDLDKMLRIKTGGRDDSKSNKTNFPYEPTDYCVLERFANQGFIRKKNVFLDYGCGKGRVDFYMSYQTRCRSIGIDYDPRMIEKALENQNNSVSGNRTEFVCDNAGKYKVPGDVDRIYFFNPFSVEILEQVLRRIRESYYENPREILLFFYYPSDEYMASLMQAEGILFFDEISCEDLFDKKDPREKIIVFQMI